MNEGDNQVRVSPAMYKLLETDQDEILQNLKVRILPAKPRREVARRKEIKRRVRGPRFLS